MSAGVSELLWRFIWILVSAILIVYVCYLYFGSAIETLEKNMPAALIIDSVSKPGEHHLRGEVQVPSQCHGLSVRTQELSNTLFHLVLTTWQEPTRTCEPHPQMRTFQTVVFAPSTGVSFVASLDGREIPISLSTRY